ncbi:uncharacterized protein LACBIDRAFT_299843 [Laccaria bicolor S238N-H82]|uniref:Predicted protein n=1 Tax=Laccaria bicolor (strain S238N-H82 / ATCC MYA-4686) TaxID=486041 RepID=B0DFJ9_LACBS|nr:uncharacterized protein LACBIDRAFT_299843 [Laccaria bicolor S238N-H82]EDR06718.1 predicted protein [Laccaria bicolor S238N-H82]|eukprot:XP_001882565.1 predicted protein [Laccaria bicolor S238N-H82]
MSGTGAKPKGQPPPQKGKVATIRQNRTAEPEVQERGKTRATGAVDLDEDEQEIGDSEKGRSYLEEKLLLVPSGALLTLGTLATTLHQIAALPGVTLPVINAVRAVAFLLKEVELGAVAEDIRDIANAQFNEMTTDLREFTEGLRVKVMEELEKKTEVLKEKTVELAEVVEKAVQQAGNAASSPYRDALHRGLSGAPMDANPRLAAKENIRQRQSLVDIPQGSSLKDCANLVLVGKFTEAMGKATAQKHKIRTALRLQNGGILVEMATDEGAAWLASKDNAAAFLRELGETEASFKKRSYNVVAYYVPLTLDPGSEKDRREIEESNNIPEGGLTKMRWIKPPARRRTDQRFAHVIATFSDADAANRAIVNGLTICNKRVSVAKSRKEPIRCLKCQGWDHIASECNIKDKEVNVCGTCGGRDHWTSKCPQPGVTFCSSCRTSDHTSWDRECPTFRRKIEDLNARDPANDLPFFPAKESWTWSPSYPTQGRRVPPAEIQVNPIQPATQRNRYRQTQINFEYAAPGGRPYTKESRSSQRSTPAVAKSPPPPFPNPESTESPIAAPMSSNGLTPP